MKNKSYSKVIAMFALVLVIASSLWFALPATLCYAQGGYGGAVDGGPSPSFTWFRDKTDQHGVFTKDATAKSEDRQCKLTINTGTTALDRRGNPLAGVIIVWMREPPAPPPSVILGRVYALRPDGATFDPPITITLA